MPQPFDKPFDKAQGSLKTQLIFEPPSPDTPGYLRRLRQAVAFQEAIKAKQLTPQVIDNLTGFLSAYIAGIPSEEAKEMLLDASENQFQEMLEGITGKDNDAKKNENGSGSGSKGRRQPRSKP